MRRVTIITIMRYVAVLMLVLFFLAGTGFAEETEVVPVGAAASLFSGGPFSPRLNPRQG
jgi:hypothetical protein